MLIDKVIFELMGCFPGSFINYVGEFVAVNDHHVADAWFLLKNCETEEDVKYKVVSRLCRPAYKSEPWGTRKKNEEFHQRIRDGMNMFLNTNFDEDDCCRIYTKFGNGINEELCRKFVRSGYDMSIIDA